jgi:hypothetical protein
MLPLRQTPQAFKPFPFETRLSLLEPPLADRCIGRRTALKELLEPKSLVLSQAPRTVTDGYGVDLRVNAWS